MNFSKTLLFSLCAAASINLLANNSETAETTAMPAFQTITSYADLKQKAIRGYWETLKDTMPSFDKCKAVIEPFFDKAEQELETIKYCMNHVNAELAQRYFFTLFCRYAPLEFMHQYDYPMESTVEHEEAIIEYCINHASEELVQRYPLTLFCRYSPLELIRQNDPLNEYAEKARLKDMGELFKMLKKIQALKEKENIPLDMYNEWRNTANVILQLNAAFFNNVSPRKKLLLDMAKGVPWVVREKFLDENLDEYLQKCKTLPKRNIAFAKWSIKGTIRDEQKRIQRCIDFKAQWDQTEVQDDDRDENPFLKQENIQYMAFLYAELEHDQHFLNKLNEQFPTDGEVGLFIRGEESDEDSDGETNQN